MGPSGLVFYSSLQSDMSGRKMSNMRASFGQKAVAASSFLIFCSLGAGILGAANAPRASARSTPTETTEVNRLNKADQLTASPDRQAQQKTSPRLGEMKTSLQRPPLGCDPAFSPVADPAHAGIYKRCTV
jgi:hypothetical protein